MRATGFRIRSIHHSEIHAIHVGMIGTFFFLFAAWNGKVSHSECLLPIDTIYIYMYLCYAECPFINFIRSRCVVCCTHIHMQTHTHAHTYTHLHTTNTAGALLFAIQHKVWLFSRMISSSQPVHRLWSRCCRQLSLSCMCLRILVCIIDRLALVVSTAVQTVHLCWVVNFSVGIVLSLVNVSR